MNIKINVAILTKYEENANNFIKSICNNETRSIIYNNYEIIIGDVWSTKNSYEQILEIAKKNDKLILLVDSVEGVTPKVSHLIEEIIKSNKLAIIVLNNVENENANPEMAIEEIQHVLVMRKASDKQLDAPIVYVNQTEKKSRLDVEESMSNLNILYEAIIKN